MEGRAGAAERVERGFLGRGNGVWEVRDSPPAGAWIKTCTDSPVVDATAASPMAREATRRRGGMVSWG